MYCVFAIVLLLLSISVRMIAGAHPTIRITATGFEPSDIRIKPQTSIRFINESNRPSQPSADPHPEHTSYGAEGACDDMRFDPCAPIPPGGHLVMTFKNAALISYHDHLMPGHGGVLRIENSSALEQIRAWFKNHFFPPVKKSDIEAFRGAQEGARKAMFSHIAKKDPRDAWDLLKAFATENGTVVFNVHDLAHIAGNELYRVYGMEGMRICDDSFAYGCRHGVSEAFLTSEGPERVVEVATQCTNKYEEAGSGDIDTGCIHGIGHGLATWENYNLKAALSWCDGLEERMRVYCYDGVFMETFEDRETGAIDATTPWDECADVPEAAWQQCARYTSLLFARIYPDDIATVAELCDRAPLQSMRETCALSIGFRESQTAHGAFDAIQVSCDRIDILYAREWCIMGAARESLFQKYPDALLTSRRLCESLDAPGRIRCDAFIAH